jgi:hypothetical protein
MVFAKIVRAKTQYPSKALLLSTGSFYCLLSVEKAMIVSTMNKKQQE